MHPMRHPAHSTTIRFTQVWPPWGNTKDREKLTGIITEVDNSNKSMVKVTCLYDLVSEGAGNFATQYSGMKYPNIALSQLLVEGMDQEIPWDNSLGARIRRKMVRQGHDAWRGGVYCGCGLF